MESDENKSVPGAPNFDEYPETVTLHFKSKAAKDSFMGGLSDGFGENLVDLDWPWKHLKRNRDGSIDGFDKQARFAVDVFEPEDE